MKIDRIGLNFFVFLCLAALANSAAAKNGFDLQDSLIPVASIKSGGPPKNGIPAIDKPKFLSAQQAVLKDTDRVLGIASGGQARAYPVNILNWHEIVNDRIGDRAIAVTYCPLCGSGVAFSALVDGKALNFGVSGLLYNSDVLLYDRETESLWSQLKNQAISGEFRGKKLQVIPMEHTTWGDWKQRYPKTRVLSQDTGYRRNYQHDPYAGYQKAYRLYFAVNPPAPEDFHPKEWVLGIEVDGVTKAYPFQALREQNKPKFRDEVNGQPIVISWNKDNESASISSPKGELLPFVRAFWFAWYAFNPKTEIFRAS